MRQGFDLEEGGQVYLEYETGKDDEARIRNFFEAAARLELTGVRLLLNEEGRRRIEAVKAELRKSDARQLGLMEANR